MSTNAPVSLYATRSLSETAASLARACRAREAEAVATFLAENIVAHYAEGQPVAGREANRQLWHGIYLAPEVIHTITVEEVVQAEQGDLGYTYGRWRLAQPSHGAPHSGPWLAVWQPVAGGWQITHLSSNLLAEIDHERRVA